MDLLTVPLDNIDDLIVWLNTLFPDKCPSVDDNEREIWIKAGRRQAAETIISKLNHQVSKGVTKNGKSIQPVHRSIRERR